MIIVIVKSTVP